MTRKTPLRDDIVRAVCNWIIDTFASREYRAKLWGFYFDAFTKTGEEA